MRPHHPNHTHDPPIIASAKSKPSRQLTNKLQSTTPRSIAGRRSAAGSKSKSHPTNQHSNPPHHTPTHHNHHHHPPAAGPQSNTGAGWWSGRAARRTHRTHQWCQDPTACRVIDVHKQVSTNHLPHLHHDGTATMWTKDERQRDCHQCAVL